MTTGFCNARGRLRSMMCNAFGVTRECLNRYPRCALRQAQGERWATVFNRSAVGFSETWSGECGVRKRGLLGSLREPDYPNERRIGEDSVGGEVVIGLKD